MKTSWTVLGLLCIAGATTAAAAAAVLAARSNDFDLRQKRESNEVNCIQIVNPAPGAVYRPGFFVRMIYGTQFCSGVSATGPWSIHLYNNLKTKNSRVEYDYHEVIAENLSATQFLWNIPLDHLDKAKNVRERSEYIVRIETTSQDGKRLVGHAGPFSIIPDYGKKKRRQDDNTSKSVKTPYIAPQAI
ncbi:hypothetical protein DFQ27_001618 [Actinomortierella ambigua]|uniref:Secreted protein n=1 Tax=Actinomortierella ambigua TaxID=1343610 RepID=A0A9P6U8J5_9FUNG|nr:hypothetical protein DFQ27_001618 [Actinomortierella ambigua]